MNFLLPDFTQPSSPVDDYCKPLEGNYVIWREMTSIPIIIAAIQLVCLLFIFKRENPIYQEHLISNSRGIPRDAACKDYFSTNIQQAPSQPPTIMEQDTWKSLLKTKERENLWA
mmetsp:Transcript_7570/g.7109  ORF Transcript_7570/g.7109 Transcript_7570/m.7109 type:complete len:114 (+) Transcript_7570:453-794(+)